MLIKTILEVYALNDSHIRACILQGTFNADVEHMASVVNQCISKYRVDLTKLITLNVEFYNEKKHFFPFTTNSTTSRANCNFLTIGIGSTSQAEREFHALYPHCRIFGIEASADAYGDFEKIGKVLPYAVGQ